MSRILLSVILGLALTTGIARADVITTYTLSNVKTQNLATVTGTFKIDQTTYNYDTHAGFDGGSVVVSDEPISTSDLNGTYSFLNYDGDFAVFLTASFSSVVEITIDRPPFTTGSVDLTDTTVTDLINHNDSFTQGTLTAVTPLGQPGPLPAVPEPSSLALLVGGLGLLRLVSAGTFRRRILGDCCG